MKITVYNSDGTKSADQITAKIFDGKINPKLISEVVFIAQSNLRQAPAKTLDRGEVAGSGIKPWRQKGTGRARAGSRRSPIWRGGGVTFGPTGSQNFHKNLPAKKNRAALLSALAAKKVEDLIVLKELKLETPNTKNIQKMLDKLKATRSVLIINDQENEILKKSVRNLAEARLISWENLNILDVLGAEKMIFLGESLNLLSRKFTVTESKKAAEALSEAKAKTKTKPVKAEVIKDSSDTGTSGASKKGKVK